MTPSRKLSFSAMATTALCLSFLFHTQAATAASTISQALTEVRYNAESDTAFFVGATGWGAPSCPNAAYAQVLINVPGKKQLLALAMAAKASGSKVLFAGECHSDPAYFNVTYIVVGQ